MDEINWQKIQDLSEGPSVGDLLSDIDAMRDENKALKARINALEMALKFYADPIHYVYGEDDDKVYHIGIIQTDAGEYARLILNLEPQP